MNTININGQEYAIDSSGAEPEEYISMCCCDGICWVYYGNLHFFGELHRLDGPAVIHNDGTKEWYQNGLRHNLKGPAIINAGGAEIWYIKDEYIGRSDNGFTQEQFEEYIFHELDLEKFLELMV